MIEKFNNKRNIFNTICAFYEYSSKQIFNHYLQLMLNISFSLCYYCLNKENKEKLFNIINRDCLDLKDISDISNLIVENKENMNIIEEFIY